MSRSAILRRIAVVVTLLVAFTLAGAADAMADSSSPAAGCCRGL